MRTEEILFPELMQEVFQRNKQFSQLNKNLIMSSLVTQNLEIFAM